MCEKCEAAAIEFAETCRQMFIRCGGAVVAVGISDNDEARTSVLEVNAMIDIADAMQIVGFAADRSQAANFVMGSNDGGAVH